jgi:hypothetical protein
MLTGHRSSYGAGMAIDHISVIEAESARIVAALEAWGRRRPADVGVEVLGDARVIDAWSELLPPM